MYLSTENKNTHDEINSTVSPRMACVYDKRFKK